MIKRKGGEHCNGNGKPPGRQPPAAIGECGVFNGTQGAKTAPPGGKAQRHSANQSAKSGDCARREFLHYPFLTKGDLVAAFDRIAAIIGIVARHKCVTYASMVARNACGR
jgi:hypothetical protein